MENSFYSEEEFAGYFKTEASSIKSLVDATDELQSKYQLSDERYTKLKPQVNAVKKNLRFIYPKQGMNYWCPGGGMLPPPPP